MTEEVPDRFIPSTPAILSDTEDHDDRSRCSKCTVIAEYGGWSEDGKWLCRTCSLAEQERIVAVSGNDRPRCGCGTLARFQYQNGSYVCHRCFEIFKTDAKRWR